MCARPFMPPPPRTRVNRVSLFTGIAACPEGELPSNVVVAPMPALLIRHRIVRSRWTIAGLAVVAALACVALLAPWLAPRDPYHGALPFGLRPPSAAYLFGTDAQGRDVLSRRSEEHTSELQSPCNLVCRLLLEKKKKNIITKVTVRKY